MNLDSNQILFKGIYVQIVCKKLATINCHIRLQFEILRKNQGFKSMFVYNAEWDQFSSRLDFTKSQKQN